MTAPGGGGGLVPCMTPSFEYFLDKEVQSVIESSFVEKARSLVAFQPGSLDTMQFQFPARPLCCADLSSLELRMVVVLKKKSNGANLSATELNVSFVDNLLHSLHSQVQLFLSETPTEKSPQNYAYKALIQTYRSATTDSLQSSLPTQLCIPDVSPKASAANNAQWTARQTPFVQSKYVELMGKLCLDLCSQPHNLLLLDNVGIRVHFTFNSPDFFLWSKEDNPDVQFSVVHAELHCRYYQISPDLSLGIEKMLQEKNAVYRFKSSQIKTFLHPPQISLISIAAAFAGKIPNFLHLCLLKTDDFNGKITSNAYDFSDCGVEEVTFHCNNTEQKYEADFRNPMQCVSMLRQFYAANGFVGNPLYNLNTYTGGRFACAVDLTPNQTAHGASQNLDLFGSIRIEIKLKEALDHSILVMVYAETESSMEISASRQVTVY